MVNIPAAGLEEYSIKEQSRESLQCDIYFR